MRKGKARSRSWLFLCFVIIAGVMSTGVSAAGFGIGDTVEVYNTGTQGLVVRGPNACDGQIGGKFDGDRGVVLAGPVYCNSYNRWKIRWSDSLEGWSAEDWLRKVSITPSTKFSIGNRVKVNANGVNVRGDTPELAVLGSVNYGDQGTVIAGPFYGVPKGSSGFYYFWKIDYDTKTDGWTAENYLDKDSCTNECSSGQTRCNENYQQTCGNYDADSCTEWPSSTSGTGNDNCNDCSCSCGGYNTAETTANGNCNDGKDNDCDGYTDGADSGCAGAQYIDGIDVSGWQHQAGDINWSQVYNEGYRFAFVKATQRDSYTNPYFKSDMDSGRNARLLVGAYHFGCPSYNPNQYCYGTSAEVEAQYFLDVAGNYLIQGYLRPVLDIDQPICDDFYNTGNCLGLRNWIDKWMDIIKTKNVTPILYTGPYCIRDCLGSSFAKKYDLWIARYGSSPCPFSSCDWDWAFWQYSETGTVPGINGYVDLDKFNGDMARLNTFLISGSNQPPNIPTSLSQRRSDNITVIPEGGTTPESTVVFKGTVNDPDGDNVRLEIELRQIGEAFTGTPTTETISGFVSSGSGVTITRYGLIDANYKWQYRAKDSKGATSSWTEFGTPGNTDFMVLVPKCTSGPCCDISMGTFRPSSYKCQEDATTDYGCPWGSGCGTNVGVHHQDRYCSGSSAQCDGALQWDSWIVADYCSSTEICIAGNPTCNYEPSCVSCACSSWQNQGCGQGGCSSTQMHQTRTCTPSGCDIVSQCVYDASCDPGYGWKSPRANEKMPDPYSAWTNPSNAYSSDNQYATTNGEEYPASQIYYDFGFDIPPGAIINGIEVAAEGKVDRVDICTTPRFMIALTKDRQTFWWTRQTNAITTSDSIVTIGGSADLWAESWAYADFGPNFGVRISVGCRSTPTTTYYLDHIKAKVYFSINHPPILYVEPNQLIYEGQRLQFMVSASDPDNDSLAFSALGLPTGAVFTDNHNGTALFNWTPSYMQGRQIPYVVSISVSDGALNDSRNVSITVANVLVWGTIYEKNLLNQSRASENATVSILSLDRNNTLISTRTDALGKFRLAGYNITDGTYVIRVSKNGLKSYEGISTLRSVYSLPFAVVLQPSGGAFQSHTLQGSVLQGTVSSEEGSAIKNALITIKNVRKKKSTIAARTTDALGRFYFVEEFPAGNYTLVFSKRGFKKLSQEFSVSANARIDATIVLTGKIKRNNKETSAEEESEGD